MAEENQKYLFTDAPPPKLMDVKNIVDKHHALIARNIVPSEELMEAIRHYKVLSEEMVNDVKDSVDREDKVYKILDLVAIKGPATMTAFCDALQHSGHAFIADFIRDEMKDLEEQGREVEKQPYSSDFMEGKDIVKYLCGRFEHAIHEKDKEDLGVYLEKKFQAALLKKMYKMNKEDKEKALQAKQHQLEEGYRYHQMLDDKDKMLEEMKTKVHEAIQESAKKGVMLNSMKQYMTDAQANHQSSMASQLKFNDVNDSSLRRLTERTMIMEKMCKEMLFMIEPYMPDPELYQTRRDSFTTPSCDRIVTAHDKFRWSLKRLLMRMADLLAMQENYNQLLEDRKYAMGQLGILQDDGSKDFKVTFQEFVQGKQAVIDMVTADNQNLKERMLSLHARATEAENRIQELEQQLSNTNTGHQSSFLRDIEQKEKEILALKANRDHLLDEHSKKDLKIAALEKELAFLQKNINLMDQTHSKSRMVPIRGAGPSEQTPEVSTTEMLPFGSPPRSKRGSLKCLAEASKQFPSIKAVPEKPASKVVQEGPRRSFLLKQSTKGIKNAPKSTKPSEMLPLNLILTPPPLPAKVSRRQRMDQYHQGK